MITKAIQEVARSDHELDLQNRQTKIKKLKNKIATMVGKFGDHQDKIIVEALESQLEKFRQEIEQEEGICRELESILRASREQASLLREVHGTINDSIHLIETADFDAKVIIMAALGVEVLLGMMTPTMILPEEMRGFSTLPATDPQEVLTVKLMRRSRPSVSRLFFH